MNAYLELTKPRITWLILMSTAVGCLFGHSEAFNWLAFLHTLLGTGLLASGTAALNQWYEWAADAQMNRTKARPIPSGRIERSRALAFGIGLSLAGFLELWFGANPLAAALGLFTLLSYLLLYTPLKRRSPHSTTVGAIPGAMPPLIGYAAAHGHLNWEAATLFGILFLWQFPHFYSIAWMYREDYGRAGIRMLPVVEPDGRSTARHILVTAVLLIPASLAPTLLDMTGRVYLYGALVAGALFLYASWQVAFEKTVERARGVLLASVVYLPVLYGLMLIDR